MRPLRVVPIEVVSNVGACCADAVVGFEVHALVFHAAPQSLDKDVVTSSATPVHVQLAVLGQNTVSELGGRELAALIGVNDLGCAVACKSIFKNFSGVAGLQRDCHFVRQHPATGHIDYNGEIDEASGHRGICRVQGPDVIRTHDR